jgi:hypothetical protein
MKSKRQFDTHQAKQRETIQVSMMIADIDRNARQLDYDILTEEERVGISDRSDPAYPILARMLATRRDNLKHTVTALERRLSELAQANLVAERA